MRFWLVLCLLFMLTNSATAENNRYEDSPVEMNSDAAQILKNYEAASISALDKFNNELSKRSAGEFYVITRLYKGKYFEQIFVAVDHFDKDTYYGFIASKPMGKVEFKYGDKISVKRADVKDWVIVKPDGTEEGNYQGKIVDLLQAGLAGFIYEATKKPGGDYQYKVVSVKNARTKQEIIDVVPTDVIAKIESHLSKHKNPKLDTTKDVQYSYVVVRFPGWDVEDNNK